MNSKVTKNSGQTYSHKHRKLLMSKNSVIGSALTLAAIATLIVIVVWNFESGKKPNVASMASQQAGHSESGLSSAENLGGKPTSEGGLQLVVVSHASATDSINEEVTYIDDLARRGAAISQDLRSITVLTDERSSTTGAFDSWSLTATTSFDIIDVDGRGFEELYVLGKARNGEYLIERWILNSGPGSYSANWSALVSGAPSQVSPGSLATSTPTVSLSSGGAYVSPPSRPAPSALREELYRGNLSTHLSEIEVDPEGRFAVLLDSTQGGLFRVEFTDPATTAEVSLGLFSGLQLANSMQIRLDDSGYYQWIIDLDNTITGWADVVLYQDANLDGWPENYALLSVTQYDASGIEQNWASTFVNSGSFGFPH